jgi:hypothetical protein
MEGNRGSQLKSGFSDQDTSHHAVIDYICEGLVGVLALRSSAMFTHHSTNIGRGNMPFRGLLTV